jgi:hypothetical protein
VGELWSGLDGRRCSLRDAAARLGTMLTDADWSEALAASTRRPTSRRAARAPAGKGTRRAPPKARR